MKSIISILACFLIHNLCAQEISNKPQPQDSIMTIQFENCISCGSNCHLGRKGIGTRYENTKSELGLRIIEFDFSVKRNDDTLYSYHNIGAYYNDKIKGIINDLKIGDIIFIKNIKLMGTDNVQRFIPIAAYAIEKNPY